MNLNELINENKKLIETIKLSDLKNQKIEEENNFLKKRLSYSSDRRRMHLGQMSKRARLNNLKAIKNGQGAFFNETIKNIGM